MLTEDLQKIGARSTSVPKPNPLDKDETKSEIFNNLLGAIKAKSVENHPFELQRREMKCFCNFL